MAADVFMVLERVVLDHGMEVQNPPGQPIFFCFGIGPWVSSVVEL